MRGLTQEDRLVGDEVDTVRLMIPAARFGVLLIENALLTFLVVLFATLTARLSVPFDISLFDSISSCGSTVDRKFSVSAVQVVFASSAVRFCSHSDLFTSSPTSLNIRSVSFIS